VLDGCLLHTASRDFGLASPHEVINGQIRLRALADEQLDSLARKGNRKHIGAFSLESFEHSSTANFEAFCNRFDGDVSRGKFLNLTSTQQLQSPACLAIAGETALSDQIPNNLRIGTQRTI
jgi:hypothetical protein